MDKACFKNNKASIQLIQYSFHLLACVENTVSAIEYTRLAIVSINSRVFTVIIVLAAKSPFEKVYS